MSVLTIEHVTHAYGDKTVLHDVNVRLLPKEHVGIVGHNGAGKSTLLRIVAGELLPDEGNVAWLSTTTWGHLEQHVDLHPAMTVMDVLRQAFQWLYDAESELLDVMTRLGYCEEEDMEPLLSRMSSIQDRLDQHQFYTLDTHIEDVAAGLGITDIGLETQVSALSGGQRTKVLLGQLLLRHPDVLLLDEPTNFLDEPHIIWLRHYLKNYSNAFLLITHDEAFMDAVVDVVWHLENSTVTRYTGCVADFKAAYELLKHQTWKAFARQQETIRQLETYTQKNKARASTARLAKSREKQLAKMEPITPPVTPGRASFAFQSTGTPSRIVMETEGLIVGYDRPLLPPLDLKLERGEKIAITGYNGIGKTTSLRTILGLNLALGGSVRIGDRVSPSYYAQEERSAVDATALEDVWAMYPILSQREIRQALARSGLRSEHIFQPIRALSGGEQSKVRLCKLMLANSNWLVLDEPTNHLDQQAKESLMNTLRTYEGTILIVSHEPWFYQDWVTAVWDIEQIRAESETRSAKPSRD